MAAAAKLCIVINFLIFLILAELQENMRNILPSTPIFFSFISQYLFLILCSLIHHFYLIKCKIAKKKTFLTPRSLFSNQTSPKTQTLLTTFAHRLVVFLIFFKAH